MILLVSHVACGTVQITLCVRLSKKARAIAWDFRFLIQCEEECLKIRQRSQSLRFPRRVVRLETSDILTRK